MPSTTRSSSAVLLAEPDADQRAAIAAGLDAAGYQVEAVPVDVTLGETLCRDWDALVLDVSAAAFLDLASAGKRLPLLILVADVFSPNDKIVALRDLRADALLERPIHLGVLTATLASLLRRATQANGTTAAQRELPRGGEEENVWKLSPTHWTLTSPDGRTAKLTRTETDFLLQLAKEPGVAIARDSLISSMGHNPDIYDTRRLDTFVSRLRGKVSNACGSSPPLRSVHAVGYAFVAPLLLID